ncbi:MAG: GGDEF domain-containing protein, partial [Thermodesulfovibrionales bacterium]|nr:GGDEF domain-containing protein [Thermodesulfovibrionales bacterium]
EMCIRDRYGGEEFAIILIETSLKEARLIAERLRKRVESSKFIHKGTTIRATMSIGIASVHSGMRIQKGKLIENADKALYNAKHNGRNQTVLWEDISKESKINSF